MNTQATGLVKKIDILPWLSLYVLRNSPSNIDPNTNPNTIGAVGNPPFSIKYPAIPITNVRITSKKLLLSANDPTNDKITSAAFR